jgi:hypothetical protein
MTDTAFMNQYRKEFIMGFEQRESLLRQTCLTEAVISGNQAIFLVTDSGDAVASTRGVDGMYVYGDDNRDQYTCVLADSTHPTRRNNWNIFASMGEESQQRMAMQKNGMGVINRKIDSTILTALSAATQTTGAAVTADLSLVMKAVAILGNNEVDTEDGNLTFVISPAMNANLMQIDGFTSADYVSDKPLGGGQSRMRKWGNYNFITHPNLAGKGTSSETCYAYHRDAIGHAVDTKGIDAVIGYNEEQAYSYARHTVFQGAKLLQNTGVVKILHDGSGYVAS